MHQLMTDLTVPLRCVEVKYQFIRIAAVAIKIAEDLGPEEVIPEEHDDPPCAHPSFEPFCDTYQPSGDPSNVEENDEEPDDSWIPKSEDRVIDKSTSSPGTLHTSDRRAYKWLVVYDDGYQMTKAFCEDDHRLILTHTKYDDKL